MDLWNRAEHKSEYRAGDIEYPTEPNLMNQSSSSETLDPERKRESAPSTNKVLGMLPKENREATANNARNRARQQKHPAHSGLGRIDRIEHPKLENENNRRESEGVEPD